MDQSSCIIWIYLSLLITSQIIATSTAISNGSYETDKEVLSHLRSFLDRTNKVRKGRYVQWSESNLPHCNWPGIICANGRVVHIDLSGSNISGPMFQNFSAFTELTGLDLSNNSIGGEISADLNQCTNLQYLNLSYNELKGTPNLTRLSELQTIDLTENRLSGSVHSSLPTFCNKLVRLNLSINNFSGQITKLFDDCVNLQYLDLSSNHLTGPIWEGFARLRQFIAWENDLKDSLDPAFFAICNLELLDLSKNIFSGQLPDEISNCRSLISLNLWGNNFSGHIPSGIGSLTELKLFFLGSNSFNREITENLLNCSKLESLDVSLNNFGGEIQPIFGGFQELTFLALHGNSYNGGIVSSGILNLPRLQRLDLSFNNFSGKLPVEISQMANLRFLLMAYNGFSGPVPSEYGRLTYLQALDVSSNRLTGKIPSSLGNLKSLLWLMLANNSLTGEIPPKIGGCSSLLWLNLANNHLSGKIPSEISTIGRHPEPVFAENRRRTKRLAVGQCFAMRRWIPAAYPPFSFLIDLLNNRLCRRYWYLLLEGSGIFPICKQASAVRTVAISGYIQLAGNNLSGEIPPEIGNLRNFILLDLANNGFSGKFPSEVARLPLVFLNVSQNKLSGNIPGRLGGISCLQNLDLSYNNFSGDFPVALNQLWDLNQFNVSYNRFLTGTIPSVGQLATFDNDSFFGTPLLNRNPPQNPLPVPQKETPHRRHAKVVVYMTLAATLVFVVAGAVSTVFCLLNGSPAEATGFLTGTKRRHDTGSSSVDPSLELAEPVKIFQLGKKAFTYKDILSATQHFSENLILGRGGFGTVYKGILPDGREVAVKKLQREGQDGEREFRAEMEILSRHGSGWPHPNLVPLHGWCLYGPEKLLVYEYMPGGSLEELITDRNRLGWWRRVKIATDVARALVFLHHECDPAVVHRDVKASNVLLDANGLARVTDFGLSREVGPEKTHVSTALAGTVGYVPPEYVQTWRANTKGDVYSYGVLVTELATGRRAADGGEVGLVDWVRRLASLPHQGLRGAVVPVMMSTMGPTRGQSSSEDTDGLREMCELLRVGLRCTADTPQTRPNMREVLSSLLRIRGSSTLNPSHS